MSAQLCRAAAAVAACGQVLLHMACSGTKPCLRPHIHPSAGTLTLNKLTVDHVNCYPLSGHSIEDVSSVKTVACVCLVLSEIQGSGGPCQPLSGHSIEDVSRGSPCLDACL